MRRKNSLWLDLFLPAVLAAPGRIVARRFFQIVNGIIIFSSKHKNHG